MSKKIDIANATQYLQKYWNTYSNQPGYDTYSDETFIADALYGLGKAIAPDKYNMGPGYDQFKKDLQTWLFKDTLKHSR